MRGPISRRPRRTSNKPFPPTAERLGKRTGSPIKLERNRSCSRGHYSAFTELVCICASSCTRNKIARAQTPVFWFADDDQRGPVAARCRRLRQTAVAGWLVKIEAVPAAWHRRRIVLREADGF